MITAFYMILAFLIYIFFTYIYIKRLINQYINEELKIISGLKNKKQLDKLPDNIKTEYTETLEKIIKQENELNKKRETNNDKYRLKQTKGVIEKQKNKKNRDGTNKKII